MTHKVLLKKQKKDLELSRILILLILFNSIFCSRTPRSEVKYLALDNTYEIKFSTDKYNFVFDSSSIVNGNPEGLSFYCKEYQVLIQIFIGKQNPPGWFKHTFDYSENTYSISEEIEKTLVYELIGIDTFYKDNQLVKFVHYIEYKQLEVIETQFLTIDNLLVNLHVAKPLNSSELIDINYLAKGIIGSFTIKKQKSG